MIKQKTVLIAVALVVLGLVVVGITLAGPAVQGPDGQDGMALENQRLGFVPAAQGGPAGSGVLENSAPLAAAGAYQARVSGGTDNLPDEAGTDAAIQARPSGLLNYQGRLLQNGSPFDGNIVMTFTLYTDATGTSLFWQETQTVSVDQGLFNVMLGAANPLTATTATWQSQVFLGVQPAGASSDLTPRQPLATAAYAMNLIPGTTMVDTNPPGAYIYSFWLHTYDHQGMRVWGEMDSSYSLNVTADGADSIAVRALSNDLIGVYGWTGGSDPGISASVWGEKGGDGVAVRGNKTGNTGAAVQGTNTGNTGSGVAGSSTNYMGLWGETARGDNNYGLYTPDNLWSLNYNLAGAIMHLAQNGDDEAIEPGDVVVFVGMAPPLEQGGPIVVQVARAGAANSTAVAGVVQSRFNVDAVTGSAYQAGGTSKAGLEVAPAGPVAPGDYLLLVVQGPAQVKASAAGGAIQAGDLLSSAAASGYAARATTVTFDGIEIALPGTVFGKALEGLTAGQGLIYVFVLPQ